MHLQLIVAFGDEDGAWAVTRTLSEFLRVLTFDGESEISDRGVAYVRDEESSENQSLYAELLAALDPDTITEADELERIVQQAQAAYPQRFTQVMQG